MSDLSRESRDVIEAGARALAPSEAARAKVRAAVAARVSGTPGAGGEGAAGQGGASVAAGGGTAAKVWLAVLVVGIAGAVLGTRWYLQESSGDGRPAASAPSAAAAPAPAPLVEPLTTGEPAAVSPVEEPAPGRARTAPRRPRPARPAAAIAKTERAGSTLELEVALLSEARRALGDGDPGRALAALARHRREIGAPQMAKEAAILRAEALCAVDRASEGRAVLADVEARWPGAAGAAAVRARCGSE